MSFFLNKYSTIRPSSVTSNYYSYSHELISPTTLCQSSLFLSTCKFSHLTTFSLVSLRNKLLSQKCIHFLKSILMWPVCDDPNKIGLLMNILEMSYQCLTLREAHATGAHTANLIKLDPYNWSWELWYYTINYTFFKFLTA